MGTKLWGGRFKEPPDEVMFAFSASISFDQRLWAEDIRGSQAYARALVRAGVLSPAEGEAIVSGLDRIAEEFRTGEFAFQPSDEDIHTAVERRLSELIGPIAGKLHTGRSRNDQVATDLRLYLLNWFPQLDKEMVALQQALVHQAEAHLETVMPGYTHFQPAQPITFAHWLLSHFWPLQRDRTRLADLRRRVGVLPLGSGALAGTPLPLDREALARDLGFSAVSENSLDAVSDRDFVAETLFWAALCQVHLSRLAEDVILWSNPSFGFVELADAYSTGSSLMPQKKNPDSLELLRGKAGRVVGALLGLLIVLKGLPSGYNRDLQEDKEALFDALDTVETGLAIATGAITTMTVRPERMTMALDPAMLATELADYLVGKGVPFRQAHDLVGQAVRRAEELNVSLSQLPLRELQALSTDFDADASKVFDFLQAVSRRRAPGGTAPEAVKEQLRRAKVCLKERLEGTGDH